MKHNARLAGTILATLLLAVAGCGSDDGDAGSSSTAAGPAAAETTAVAAGGEQADADGEEADDGTSGGGDNPCEVVTQAQWETLFGAGVKKSDASGGKDNCNVLTSGSSPGHEVEFTNFSANLPNTDFDAQVGYNPPCGSEPAKALSGVGDKAVIDTSCLTLSGSAWVLAEQGGDVFGVFVNMGAPSKAPVAEVEQVLTTIAKDALAAR